MGDKETRKRKKQRRESAKKEETDDSSPPREAPQEQSNKKKDSDHSSHSLNQPSILAKLIFCILFILLVSAVGLIFYALNEATRESSDVTEGDIDHGHDSEALPMVDDLHEFGDKEDDAHSDEESEEHEGDISHSENSIEEILNSIEEAITYDVDGQDTNNQETKLDSLNNEDNELEELDNPSSESARTPQSDSINVIDPRESPTASPEELYLYSSDDKPHEEPIKENQADINADLATEELLVDFPSETISSKQPNLNMGPQSNEPVEVPSFQEPVDFNELDSEGENIAERSDITVEEAIISDETEEVKIQPSEMTQNFEDSPIYENLEHQEPLDINEDVEEPQPEPYENDDITNDYDFLFKEELDETDKLVEKDPENGDFYFWNF